MTRTPRHAAAVRPLLVTTLIVSIGLAAGCASTPQYGNKKSDWAKTPPPPTWRGPGQPSGPPAQALSGPKTPVPANAPGVH